jgi:hypothetical protein
VNSSAIATILAALISAAASVIVATNTTRIREKKPSFDAAIVQGQNNQAPTEATSFSQSLTPIVVGGIFLFLGQWFFQSYIPAVQLLGLISGAATAILFGIAFWRAIRCAG